MNYIVHIQYNPQTITYRHSGLEPSGQVVTNGDLSGMRTMAELSNAEAALLGLLCEGPMYPYQIEQQVKYRDMRFWTELSMSSIYKLLRKLEKEGRVTRTNIISAENRLRKLYAASEPGRRALRRKLETLLSEPEHIRWQVDIGTYNCDLLPGKTVQAALKGYRAALQEKIKGYEALLKFLKSAGCPPHRFGVATRPVFLLKGEIQWVDAYLLQARRGSGR
jgi:DNA-binding PadR family transcriptional regulator